MVLIHFFWGGGGGYKEEHTFSVIPASHLLADRLVVICLLFNEYEVGVTVYQVYRLKFTETLHSSY